MVPEVTVQIRKVQEISFSFFLSFFQTASKFWALSITHPYNLLHNVISNSFFKARENQTGNVEKIMKQEVIEYLSKIETQWNQLMRISLQQAYTVVLQLINMY